MTYEVKSLTLCGWNSFKPFNYFDEMKSRLKIKIKIKTYQKREILIKLRDQIVPKGPELTIKEPLSLSISIAHLTLSLSHPLSLSLSYNASILLCLCFKLIERNGRYWLAKILREEGFIE